jgi:hypothetical protein
LAETQHFGARLVEAGEHVVLLGSAQDAIEWLQKLAVHQQRREQSRR